MIELTDIESILAAMALVGAPPAGHSGPHPELWVVITGGMLGIVLVRFAALLFIKLLDRFPRFQRRMDASASCTDASPCGGILALIFVTSAMIREMTSGPRRIPRTANA